ncbi:MAG: alpha/beta fold hydrolase [Rhizobiales bacterium]|nr:alpha/beta fold hydrolase [Hyphomicrobiales bacterium]
MTRLATTADGAKIRYKIWGTPQANNVRIVLVHSLAMDLGFWDGVAKAMSDQMEVLVFDCRGHGKSSPNDGKPFTVEGFASDLKAILDHAGWSESVVAGASMGGCVALAFAQIYPKRTQALGLIDTTSWYGENATEAWESRTNKALEGGMQALVDFQKTRWFSDAFREAQPDVVDAAVGVFLKNDLNSYAETCRMLGRCDLRSGLGDMKLPVSILVGEEDYATPIKMADGMHKAIEGSTLEILPNLRHFTPLEQPETIASHLSKLVLRQG